MNRTLYSCLFYLALPLVALRLWLRARKAPAYAKRVGERFSYGLPRMQPGGIWVHAVSVGESIAAAPMIRGLLERYPQLPMTVTCMTPTGSERIQALFADEPRVQHCYLPYDLPCAAKRFLDRVQPKLAVIMETELWPNHIHACAQRGIPVALANARLSARSAKGYARFAKLTAPMLAEMSLIAVQTETEAERFRSLGARPDTVQVTGSIKFDLTIDPQLLVFSAGDNRTGSPYNDQFKPTSFPMVAFMNFIGFDASAYGNHEFDSRPDGLAKVVALSNFPYLCANLTPVPEKGINHIPYKGVQHR